MRKRNCLIAAASLVLIGCLAFVGVMTALGWDFSRLSTARYETNCYELEESFSSVSIVGNTADIVFLPSEDLTCSVECYEQENVKHAVSVKEGKLLIEVEDTRKWYQRISIGFRSPKITVYMPQGAYASLTVKDRTGDIEIPSDFQFESIDLSASTGDIVCLASATGLIKIKTTTGDITLKGLSAGELDLSVTTGDVTVSEVTCVGDAAISVSTGKAEMSDVTCRSLSSEGDTGDILLRNVIATEGISVTRDTGDVTFDGCDAADIFVETDTGDVEGSLLSDKIFVTQTDTGSVHVPSSAAGGRCEITTDTGDIRISIQS